MGIQTELPEHLGVERDRGSIRDGTTVGRQLARRLRKRFVDCDHEIEARTGKVLLTRIFRMRLEDWRDPCGQPLPLAPALSVETVEMTDRDGAVTDVPAGLWRLVPDHQRPILAPVGSSLPPVPIGGHVTVRFAAGFGTSWDRVPGDLAHAVMMLAARYYEDRGFDGTQLALPHGVGALIERWRAVRTLAGRGGNGWGGRA